MKKRLLPFAAMAAILASCSSENVLETNPDPTGQALSFSIAVGHTRATETTINNLGNFAVVAKGVHPHGGVYDHFLIGDASAGETVYHKDDEWKLDRNVYWPTSIDNALFWAYTCAQEEESKNTILPEECTFKFDNSNKSVQLSNFSPAKSDLTTTASDGLWADGRNQVDLLVAFTQAERKSGSTVTLSFKHALSQMDIKAKSNNKKSNDHRVVYIKGAWIINTKDKADLISGYSWDSEKNKATETSSWNNHGFKDPDQAFSAYGSFYKQLKTLDDSNDELNLLDNQTLMFIPQKITAWDKGETNYSKNQSYILLLCRVELKHSGATHTGGGAVDPNKDDDIAVQDEYHNHKMFPVNENKTFNEQEYGFACVPVGTTFEMGKKYIFNLDICGVASGAGNYPPETDNINFENLLPTGENKFTSHLGNEVSLSIVKRPDNKKIGDPILDEEINFSVEVSPWADGGTWTNGSETQTTEE